MAKYFLNWGTICPPVHFYSKNVLEVAGKKDRLPLTAALKIFTPMRRLGNGKYDNQQRLGLIDKGGDDGRLMAAVNGTTAAAALVQVQRVAVDGAVVRHQWQWQSNGIGNSGLEEGGKWQWSMRRRRWQWAAAAPAADGAMRAGEVGRVCGGDRGNNNSSYVKAAMAAAAVSCPGCGCGIGRQWQTEQ